MRRIADAFAVALILYPVSALADGSFAGRTRFDLDRADIQQFVETTAAEQKMELAFIISATSAVRFRHG